MQDDVSEKQDTALLLDRRRLAVHHLRDLPKRTVYKLRDQEHLRLPCLDVFGVPTSLLAVGEPELRDGCGVAVRRSQHHLHAEVLEASPSVTAAMVRRPVHDDDDPLTPAFSVRRREAGRELGQEQLHDGLVRVALRLS